jgi:hypothetical protein
LPLLATGRGRTAPPSRNCSASGFLIAGRPPALPLVHPRDLAPERARAASAAAPGSILSPALSGVRLLCAELRHLYVRGPLMKKLVRRLVLED